MSAPPFDAVVFDCDGTLVDSERLSRAAMTEVLAEDGYTVTDDDYAAVVGRAWPHTRAYLADRVGYDEAQLEAYLHRARAAFRRRLPDLEVHADAVATLDELADRGVPVGVCTSSGREHLDLILGRPELRGRFGARVAREDTDEHKPLPAPYLLAAERLGVAPGRCVVVEDTPTGIASARAAGMAVVAVDRGYGLDLAEADRIVESVTPNALSTASRARSARHGDAGR